MRERNLDEMEKVSGGVHDREENSRYEDVEVSVKILYTTDPEPREYPKTFYTAKYRQN